MGKLTQVRGFGFFFRTFSGHQDLVENTKSASLELAAKVAHAPCINVIHKPGSGFVVQSSSDRKWCEEREERLDRSFN